MFRQAQQDFFTCVVIAAPGIKNQEVRLAKRGPLDRKEIFSIK